MASDLPEGTLVASRFAGLGDGLSGGYYTLLLFELENGAKHGVALPPEQISAIVSSACVTPQRVERADSNLASVQIFQMRDASVQHATDGQLILRIGFLDQSNIHFRLPRATALALAGILERAAQSSPPGSDVG